MPTMLKMKAAKKRGPYSRSIASGLTKTNRMPIAMQAHPAAIALERTMCSTGGGLAIRSFSENEADVAENADSILSFCFARTPQRAAGFGVRVFSVFDHLDAVYENVFHA